jgi:hypothetical protein
MIENEEIIKKILKHLGMWEVNPPQFQRVKVRPPPKAAGPPKPPEHHIDYSMSQIFVSDKWLYVDLEYPESLPY